MATNDRLKIAPLFRRNLRPRRGTPNLISRLPPELRNRVYDLSLSDSLNAVIVFQKGQSKVEKKKYGPLHEPPLLQTCKQIRTEAAPMFYKSVVLEIPDSLYGNFLARHVGKIRSVVQLCGPKPFKEVAVHIRRYLAAERLDEVLQLLELRPGDAQPFFNLLHRAGVPWATTMGLGGISCDGQEG